MKAAVYARVSTDDQTEDLQLRDLRAYCAMRGWVAKEFIDHGVSGRRARRPALDALWAAVRNREVDIVVVWRFDRFGRTVRQLIIALEEFRELGVEFASIREQMDTTTPLGRAMFTVAAAFAELESNVLGERTKAGMRAARERGSKIGRPAEADGAEVVQLHKRGKKTAEIAASLGLHVTTVRRVLRRTTVA